jgi:peptidoglycan/LPS O-acetylase OafA/YrhL
MNKMETNKLSYIDVLRGIAIILVITVHHGMLFGQLPLIHSISGFGQMGVQLFFVASAYTLCLSASRRREPLRNFYIRRLFRIAPLYYFAIGLYAIVAYTQAAFGGVDRTADYSLLNIASNLLFLHGLVPSANNSVVPGGWSIATEMMFYAIFPLLFRALSRWSKLLKGWLPWAAVGGAFAANLIAQLLIIAVLHRSGIANNSFLYYSLLNQLPVFLVGMALYFGQSHVVVIRDTALMLAAGIACVICIKLPGHIGAILAPLLAGVCFAFLFGLVRHLTRGVGVLARVGEASYSMYVVHFIYAWWLTGRRDLLNGR